MKKFVGRWVLLLLLATVCFGLATLPGCKTVDKQEKKDATLQEFLAAEKPSW